MNPDRLVQLFAERAGGECVVAPADLEQRLKRTRAFVFDWDGVFNTGAKTADGGSTFDEADAMGTNLLRFGYWLEYGELPFTAIITGEENPGAIQLVEREHFNAIYFRTRHKTAALNHIHEHLGIDRATIAYGFDDVLDLPIAEACGLRLMVARDASALFTDYVKKNNLCDYVTGQPGGRHAVREMCELLLGLAGQFDEVIRKRGEFEPHYRRYLEARNSVQPKRFTYSPETGIVEGERGKEKG